MITVLQFWLACAGIAGLLVVLAWAGSRRRRVRVRDLTAGDGQVNHCGNCGYDLTGLAGGVCPECGSDLTLVGRMAPSFRRWQAVPVTARTVIWTVAVAAMALALALLGWDFAVPRTQTINLNQDWKWAADWTVPVLSVPVNARGKSLTVLLNANITRDLPAGDVGLSGPESLPPDRQRWSEASIAVYFSTPPGPLPGVQGWLRAGPRGEARVDPRTPFLDPNGRPLKNPPTDARGTIEYLLKSARYDGSFGSISDLSAKLVDDVNAALTKGELRLSTGVLPQVNLRLQPVAPPAHRNEVLAGYLLAWLAVWAAGLPFVVRKRSTRVRGSPSPPAPA